MVLDMLNEYAASTPIKGLAGLVLLLSGWQHVFMPGSSLIVELFQMLQISGGGIEAVARLAGIGVGAAGLGMIGNAAEMLGIY